MSIAGLASRLNIGTQQSVVISAQDPKLVNAKFVLDLCEVQNVVWPATITNHPTGDVDVTDNIRFAPVELTLSGVIASTPITFGPLGQAIKGQFDLDATTNVDSVPEDLADKQDVFSDSRASKLLAALNLIRLQREPVLVKMSWIQLENMVIGKMSARRDRESGDSINVSLSFKRVKIANLDLDIVSAIDTDAVARGAGGTQDLGSKAANDRPTSPQPISELGNARLPVGFA